MSFLQFRPTDMPDELTAWLTELVQLVREGDDPSVRPETLRSPFGEHGITYGTDEFGDYFTFGFNLPDSVYAEIEDGTYGKLQGFRIYFTEESGDPYP